MKNIKRYVLGVANWANLTYKAFSEGYQAQSFQIFLNMSNLYRTALKLAKLEKKTFFTFESAFLMLKNYV